MAIIGMFSSECCRYLVWIEEKTSQLAAVVGWFGRGCLFSSDWSLYTASSSVDSFGHAFRFPMAIGRLESVYSGYL